MYSTIHLSDEDQTDDIDVDIWKFVLMLIFKTYPLQSVCLLQRSHEKSCIHISLSTDILLKTHLDIVSCPPKPVFVSMNGLIV